MWCLVSDQENLTTRQLSKTNPGMKMLELHLDSVFQFGISRYFPGILPTDTKGKLGRDVLVLYIWREPLFSLKGRLLPPCRRPSRYVPYKGTFVPYDGTFGASDQGQTLDV